MARQDQIANDLANAVTPGYKSDRVSIQSFGELLVTDLGSGKVAGSVVAGARAKEQVTDLRPNILKPSDEPLDMAISGEGYFQIQTPQGPRFTRNGQFQASAQGTLVDQLGNPVLGQNGQPVRIGANGTVQATDVGCFAVPNARKAGDNSFTGTATGKGEGQVKTGNLEMSRTDAARTVIQMMASLRAIEAGQKVLTTIDETLGKANTVGNLR